MGVCELFFNFEMLNKVLLAIREGVIIINSSRTIVFINDAALKILHFERENVQGKDVCSTIPNTRLHLVLKTTVPEYDKIQYLEDTIIVTSRIPIFDEAGNVMGVTAIFRDITSIQKMAEEVTSLKKIEATLKAIIDSTRDAISVADENGDIIMVNPEYTRITGIKSSDVVGKSATFDVAEGESIHLLVSKSKKPVLGKRLIVGKTRKEVIVDVMPLFVDKEFKGSVGVIHDVTEISNLMKELADARTIIRRVEARYTFDDIIGKSEKMIIAVEQAKKVAATSATVLLRGDSGTGKELFAHAIHHSSNKASGPFVSVNCASLGGENFSYELFGYSEGAFAGASQGGKKGLLSQADGGTLFLDEISMLDRSAQSKFLRFIQTREFHPIGMDGSKKVDVRIIAATNANLEKMVESGEFLLDLYYRLNVVPLFIPPLRDRLDDIPKLVHHIRKKFNKEYGRDIRKISPIVFKMFTSYDWPGNVRELENIIGRAMIKITSVENELIPEHFDFMFQDLNSRKSTDEKYRGKLKDIIDSVEKQAIDQALYRNQGNREKTAKDLGISLRNLYYKIEKYEL